jgi:hypothetical protein
MSIDLLFRNIKEIQFKADKLLKVLPMNDEDLRTFSALSLQIRKDLLRMEAKDELASFVEELTVLNPDHTPELNAFEKLLGAITFRWWTNRSIRLRRERYFTETIRKSKVQFTHVEYLLKSF